MTAKDEKILKELWAINPTYNDGNHNFESTRNVIRNIISCGMVTTDNQPVTLELIYKRYKQYFHVKTNANDGTDPKYVKKENKIKSIFEYVLDGLYNSEEVVPRTSKHFYFWGDHPEDYILKTFDIFKKLCK